MENDFIYRHKVYLEKEVKKGDIIVFHNTAGYFMDFSRSDMLRQNISKTIVL